MLRFLIAVGIIACFMACATTNELDPSATPEPSPISRSTTTVSPKTATIDLRTITAGVVATVEAQHADPVPTVHPQFTAYQARLEEAGISPTQRQTSEACRWLLALDEEQHTLKSYYRRQLDVALEQPWTSNVVVTGRQAGEAAFEQWNNDMNTKSAERQLIRARINAIYLAAQAMDGMDPEVRQSYCLERS